MILYNEIHLKELIILNEFYTNEEVAKLFKISKKSVNNLVVNGILNPKEVYVTPVIKNYLFYILLTSEDKLNYYKLIYNYFLQF